MCEHVEDIDDSCGCIEIAEEMSEKREQGDDDEETGIRCGKGSSIFSRFFL